MLEIILLIMAGIAFIGEHHGATFTFLVLAFIAAYARDRIKEKRFMGRYGKD